MNIIVCGDGGHGKDEFCKQLGLPYTTSSRVALDEFIWDEMSWRYDDKEACFADRRNNREEWKKLINGYNSEEPTRLAEKLFEKSSVYCGIRNRTELYALKEKGIADVIIWINNPRVGSEPTNDITAGDCDITIENNGTIACLKNKAVWLRKILSIDDESVKDIIVNWADSVFPDRTITNAISKMVLEEIPEYLMDQKDAGELADIGILLYDISNLAGVDLDQAIRDKMEINKKRTWAIDSLTGLMNHTGEE